MDTVVTVLLQGILLGSLYALYGAGLALIFGVMRLVNLAHGDFIICASYLAFVITQVIGLGPFFGLLIVVPVFFGLGYLIQMGILNFTLGKGQLPPLLVTFGMSVILQNGLLLGFTADNRRLDAGGIETTSFGLFGNVSVGVLPLITLSITLLIMFGMQTLLTRSTLGRALRSTSDDAVTAEIMGINSKTIYGVAMGLALALASIAGVLLGIRTSFTPVDGPSRLIYGFEAVIIGGLGSLWGSLAGGLLLGLAQSIGAQASPGWSQLSGHFLTLLVLAIRPTGLFARTRDA